MEIPKTKETKSLWITNNKKKSKIETDIYRIGSYEIFLENQIGIGGYSIVYIGRCIDENLATKYKINKTKNINGEIITHIVAIKKIVVKGMSYKYQKMMADESKLMTYIKNNPHPNIVTCYDIIDDLDTLYIIMEYCDSGDMSKIIGKPMKENSIRYYFSQLIEGIKYLDTNSIIHRDIKPKNLLLCDNKRILKICDFGLAKNKTGLSRVYTICGSPLYMAPEMFNEKSYNDAVDVWALGIIMYEMIYGINPLHKMKDYSELESFMINSEDISVPKNSKSKNIISEKCLDLLRTLLIKKSSSRITLLELYSHSWLKENDEEIFQDCDPIQDSESKDCEFSDSDHQEEELPIIHRSNRDDKRNGNSSYSNSGSSSDSGIVIF